MGWDSEMIALDSNAMTHLIDALSSVSGPPTGADAEEKIALARIFLWLPSESCFHLTPTVEQEYKAIREQDKLDLHESWTCHLSALRPLPDSKNVRSRADELRVHHRGEKDRSIVAECELTGIKTLLTADRDLLKLGTATKVRLCLPTEYWKAMMVLPGCPTTKSFPPSNPLGDCAWWRW